LDSKSATRLDGLSRSSRNWARQARARRDIRAKARMARIEANHPESGHGIKGEFPFDQAGIIERGAASDR
jgi:hypothetical protein